MRLRTPVLLPAVLILAACEPGTGSDPGGEYRAVLESPNGAEGAAAIELTGPGIQSVTAADAGRLFTQTVGNMTHVVLVQEPAGDIEFNVTMAQGQQPPTARVVEVADGSDRPRASVEGYRVTFSR